MRMEPKVNPSTRMPRLLSRTRDSPTRHAVTRGPPDRTDLGPAVPLTATGGDPHRRLPHGSSGRTSTNGPQAYGLRRGREWPAAFPVSAHATRDHGVVGT